MSEDPLHRASRWKAFYEEDGGIREVIADIRAQYFAKASSLGVKDTDALLKLSMADKIAQEIDSYFQGIIAGGTVEAERAEHAKRIAKVGRWY